MQDMTIFNIVGIHKL